MEDLQELVQQIVENVNRLTPDMLKTVAARTAHRRARKLSIQIERQLHEFRRLSIKANKEETRIKKEKYKNGRKGI